MLAYYSRFPTACCSESHFVQPPMDCLTPMVPTFWTPAFRVDVYNHSDFVKTKGSWAPPCTFGCQFIFIIFLIFDILTSMANLPRENEKSGI